MRATCGLTRPVARMRRMVRGLIPNWRAASEYEP